MPDQVQTVKITLSDGRVGYFFGRPFVTVAEVERGLAVTDIEFAAPVDMPAGCSWETLAKKDDVK